MAKKATDSQPPSTQPSKTVRQAKSQYAKLTRPKIPEQTQRELWARAAGRCQFRGCNKLLYRDEITKETHNGATIAHIVAYSPDGPRGDLKRSKALEKDISNLMLTCKTHGSHIDDSSLVDQYPEKLLLEFKTAHEQRIERTTAALDSHKTALLLVPGAISGKRVEIAPEEARKAISPRWPDSDAPTLIDLNDLVVDENRDAYWEVGAAKVKAGVSRLLQLSAGEPSTQHISIFGLAPIPLMVLLGAEIGSRIEVDLFQKHRHKPRDPWCWDEGEPGTEDALDVYVPAEKHAGVEDIAIIVSMTSNVEPEAVAAAIGRPHLTYELKARTSGPSFLKYRSQLTTFTNELYKVMTQIRDNHKGVQRAHFILACPAPVAIEAGRSLIEKADPEIYVYEYRQQIYRHVLTINPKENA